MLLVSLWRYSWIQESLRSSCFTSTHLGNWDCRFQKDKRFIWSILTPLLFRRDGGKQKWNIFVRYGRYSCYRSGLSMNLPVTKKRSKRQEENEGWECYNMRQLLSVPSTKRKKKIRSKNKIFPSLPVHFWQWLTVHFKTKSLTEHP